MENKAGQSPTFDICFVTFNSQKWLENCVKAFAELEYNKKKVSLYFADNGSVDNTLDTLEALQRQYRDTFSNFEVIQTGENGGFGKGSNRAAAAGKGDYVFFCNVDTEIFPDALEKLEEDILANPDYTAFELRQFPNEHPKFYNPISLEVSWASGACVVIKREALRAVGGFDESIFMYCEDVDLSYRLRMQGFKIKYVPQAIINHYTMTEEELKKPKPFAEAANLVGLWILGAKYLSKKNFRELELENERIRLPEILKDEKTALVYETQIEVAKKNLAIYRNFYKNEVRNHPTFKTTIQGGIVSFGRSGGPYKNRLAKEGAFFTVLVRTYQRPDSLKKTLLSLTHQTYKNFEVLVCEDGETPVSEAAVNDFNDRLNIRYYPINENLGRCIVANRGIALAKGEYINFLDDDDYLFPEHFEVMANEIAENPENDMFMADSVVYQTDSIDNFENADFRTLSNRGRSKANEIDMIFDNITAIQSVAFHRSLYEKYGLFDEVLKNGYEDWDLWVRYMLHANYRMIDKGTSCYRVPLNGKKRDEYGQRLFRNFELFREKLGHYEVHTTADKIVNLHYSKEVVEACIHGMEESLGIHKTMDEILASNLYRKTLAIRKVFSVLASFFSKLAGPVNDDVLPYLFVSTYKCSALYRLGQFLGKIRKRN